MVVIAKRTGVMLALCCGCISQSIASPNTDKAMVDDILVYVNEYRMHHGLPQLTLNAMLSKEAIQHSLDMAQHKVGFGHDGFPERIKHAHQYIPDSQGGAENVAYNYKTAKIVVNGWINSSGHRRNILGHYNLTGIGIVRDNQGKPYFTQLFLKV